EISRATSAEAAETSARQAADAAETSARLAADTTLSASILAETNRATTAEGTLTTNLTGEVSRAQAAEATKADLITPVQLDNTAVLHNNCTAVNALVLNSTQPSSQQLFICRDAGNNVLDWELINDDSSTTTAANQYTDQQVAAEALARQAADTAEATARQQGDANTLGAANAHADAGDVTTLSSANAYTNTAVGNEAALRVAGDLNAIATAQA